MSSIDFQSLQSLKLRSIYKFSIAQPLGFIFACGFLFFEYVRPQTIYPWLDIFPWGSFFALAGLLASFFSSTNAHKLNSIDKYMIGFSLAVFLSSCFALYPAVSFNSFNIFYPWLIVYFCIVRNVLNRSQFFVLFLLYFLANFKMSQHGFGSWALRGFSFAHEGVYGAPGWFHNSGEFGIQMCMFAPMAACMVIPLRNLWPKTIKFLMYFAVISALASIVASSSRGAMVGIAAAALWAVLISKYKFRAALLVGLAAIVVLQVIPPEFTERFTEAGSDGNSRHRMERWEDGWETMKKYPLLGVGYNNWTTYYPRNFVPDVPGTPLVHNFLVEAGTEHGFTGAILLILLLLSMFSKLSKVRKHAKTSGDPYSEWMSLGLSCGLIGFIISGSFVTVLYYPYIWIHAALCSCFYNSYELQSKLSEKTTKLKSDAGNTSPPRTQSPKARTH